MMGPSRWAWAGGPRVVLYDKAEKVIWRAPQKGG